MPPSQLGQPEPSELLVYEDAEPVFIVGSVRSGTSIMVKGVRDGAGIPGFHEGNVATMVQRMQDHVSGCSQASQHAPPLEAGIDLKGLSGGAASGEALSVHMQNFVTALYVKIMGPGRWLDKSPDAYLEAPMIRNCPQLLRAFPKAKFIWCVRRGIENVLSRQRKFPDIPFRSYCRSWSDAVRNWHAVKGQLQGRFIEVHQHDIAMTPGKVAADLAQFLELDDAKRASIEDIFANKRLEQSRVAQEHRWIGLDETRWSEEERAIFIELCSESMELMGYSLEAKTIRAASAIRLFFPVSEGAVETTAVEAGHSGFFRPDENSLGLRPNPADGPWAEVHYKQIALSGHCRFQVQAAVNGPAQAATEFRLRLEDPAGAGEVFAATQRVEGGKSLDWSVDFPAQQGRVNVIVGARLCEAGVPAEGVHTIWESPRLELG